MTFREWLFAVALAAAVALVVAGVAMWSTPAALIAAGVGVGVYSWLILGDTP